MLVNRLGLLRIGLLLLIAMHGSAGALAAQSAGSVAGTAHASEAPVARAVRTSQAPSIDGILDEAVWMTAPPITDFTQLLPEEGQPVTQRTEVRFLYDDENIYVGAWLYETVRVVSRLARRDTPVGDADFFVILFDSYHDHRTAYRFATSPAGMKRDQINTGGVAAGAGDTSWDPVWEVRTTVTEEGWFVEMRIPFSQLRYSAEDVQVWGLQIERKLRSRGPEDTVWAFTPSRERGGVARFGHLVGVEGIAQGKRLELLPYVSGRAEYARIPRNAEAPFDNPFRSGSDYFGNAGVDLKYRLTSNLTLDATINPDFGQVELDPAVINLTAFETRFDEKRQFFVDGAEIFRFGEAIGRPGAMDSQLVYSRRVGRAPQGSVPASALYTDMPFATTILGALKVSGKTAGGWSMAALNAVTGRSVATYAAASDVHERAVVEPLSNYFAGRVRRDMREGAASIGVIATGVQRDLRDDALRSRLRSSAYAFGIDGRVDWDNRAWTLAGEFSPSRVAGDPAAIDAAQRSSARYLHRPDATHLSYDPGATSMEGFFGRVDLSKQAGLWQGKLMATAISPGYEVNDLGFQLSADRLDVDGNLGYSQTLPGRYLRQWSAFLGPASTWNFAGDAVATGVSASGSGQLLTFQTFNWRIERRFAAWNDRLTRGGPLTRQPAGYAGNIGVANDRQRQLHVRANVNLATDDGGGWQRGVGVNGVLKLRENYELQIGPSYRRSRTAAQYVTTVADPLATHTFGRRYVFAGLDETTLGLDTRFNATFTPDLSLELYAQPFLSSGDYRGLAELAAARTFEFSEYGSDHGSIERTSDGRYTVDPDGSGPAPAFRVNDLDFNFRSLLGNAVFRWEWRPGSTLFLVWQQTRSERLSAFSQLGDPQPLGGFDLQRDGRALWGLRPSNILLLKLNYWLNP